VSAKRADHYRLTIAPALLGLCTGERLRRIVLHCRKFLPYVLGVGVIAAQAPLKDAQGASE
jgi:hypothetical protein